MTLSEAVKKQGRFARIDTLELSDTSAADSEKVKELQAKLKSLMKDNDSDAIDVLEELLPLVNGTPQEIPLKKAAGLSC